MASGKGKSNSTSPKADVELLFGVLGEGTIAQGTSGGLIKDQLESIRNELNKNPLEIKVKFGTPEDNTPLGDSLQKELDTLSNKKKFAVEISKIKINKEALDSFKRQLSSIISTINLDKAVSVTLTSTGSDGVDGIGNNAEEAAKKIDTFKNKLADLTKIHEQETTKLKSMLKEQADAQNAVVASEAKVQEAVEKERLKRSRKKVGSIINKTPGYEDLNHTQMISARDKWIQDNREEYEKIYESFAPDKINSKDISDARRTRDECEQTLQSLRNLHDGSIKASQEAIKSVETQMSTTRKEIKSIEESLLTINGKTGVNKNTSAPETAPSPSTGNSSESIAQDIADAGNAAANSVDDLARYNAQLEMIKDQKNSLKGQINKLEKGATTDKERADVEYLKDLYLQLSENFEKFKLGKKAYSEDKFRELVAERNSIQGLISILNDKPVDANSGAAKEMNNITESAKKASTATSELKAQLNSLNKQKTAVEKRLATVDGHASDNADLEKLQETRTAIQQWDTAIKALEDSGVVASDEQFQSLQNVGVVLRNNIEAVEESIQATKRATKESVVSNQEQMATLKQVTELYKKVTEFINKNPRITGTPQADQLNLIKDTLFNIRQNSKNKPYDFKTNLPVNELNNMMSVLSNADVTFGELGKKGNTLFGMIDAAYRKFGGWALVTRSMMAAVRAIKQMVENVKALDTAMTELKKVTNETDEAYNKFLRNAVTRSKELGATLVDTVTATADFARLGYSIEEASNLADAALVYKNVGDGIESISDASASVISTMKAFGIEAKDAMFIVDKFNEVGNNFAISSKGVGDALLRSASSLASANNTIDESIALITAANNVVQDPEKIGTALKTISMYLRAAKTEAEEAGVSTDGMADSVSKLREDLLMLTGGRLDLQINSDTFKSTYQIMKELSEIWGDLSDITQANIIEKIGGKRNGNIITGLLTNFDTAEKVIATSADAAGSALAENEKYLDSIAGKTAQFQASFEALSSSIISSGFIKGLVDGGTTLLNLLTSITDTVGSLPVLISAVTAAYRAYQAAKNKKNIGMFDIGDNGEIINKSAQMRATIKALKNDIENFNIGMATADSFKDSNVALSGYLNTLNGAPASYKGFVQYCRQAGIATDNFGKSAISSSVKVGVLNSALGMLKGMAIGIAINLALKALDAIVNRLDRLKEKADEAKRAYEESSSKLDDVNKKLEENRLAIEEINKNPLDITKEETLTTLRQENEELAKQKIILEEINNINQAKSAEASEEYLTGNISPAKSVVDFIKDGEWEKAKNVIYTGNPNGISNDSVNPNDLYIPHLMSASEAIAFGVFSETSGTTDFITSTEIAISNLNSALTRRNELLRGGLLEEETSEFVELNSQITGLNETITSNLQEINNYKDNLSPDSLAYQRITEFESKYSNMVDDINKQSVYSAINEDYEKAKKKITSSSYSEFFNSGKDSIGLTSEISDDIKELFDSNVGDTRFTVTGNLVEQEEKLRNIIDYMSVRNGKTADESKLLADVEARYRRITKITGEYGDSYIRGLTAEAQIVFDNYINNNPLKYVNVQNYDSWYGGLLKSADGNKDLETKLKVFVDLVFPKEDVETDAFHRAISTGKYTEDIDKFKNNLLNGHLVTEEEIEANENFSNLMKSLNVDTKRFVELLCDFIVVKEEDYSLTSRIKGKYEEATKSVNSFIDSQQDLGSIIKEYRENGELSAESIMKLTEAGYANALVIDEESHAVRLDEEAFRDLVSEKIKAETLKYTAKLEEIDEEKKHVDKLAAAYFGLSLLHLNSLPESIQDEIKQRALKGLGKDFEADEKAALAMKENLDGLLDRMFNPENSGGKDKNILDFEAEYDKRKHLLAMEQITEKEFLDWLDDAYKHYFSDLSKYQEEYWKYEEEVYTGRKNLYKEMFESEIKYQESMRDKLVQAYDDEIDKLNKQKEKLDEVHEREEKILAVKKAQQELERARNQRTVQMVLSDGTISYRRDEEKVKSAEETLQDAIKDLNDFEFERQISAIEETRDTLKAIYDRVIEMLEAPISEDQLQTASNPEVWEEVKSQTSQGEDGKVIINGTEFEPVDIKDYFGDKFPDLNLDSVANMFGGLLLDSLFNKFSAPSTTITDIKTDNSITDNQNRVVFHIGEMVFPDVTDGQSFAKNIVDNFGNYLWQALSKK